jgi:hypothetical protein
MPMYISGLSSASFEVNSDSSELIPFISSQNDLVSVPFRIAVDDNAYL